MKKILILFAFVLFAGTLNAQQQIKSGDLGDFHGVSLSGNINAELIRSDVNMIEIQLYEADIKKFTWSISNGVLTAALRPTVGNKTRADIRIYYKDDLRDISITDAKLTCREVVEGDMLRVSVSGGANADIEVDVMDLDLSVTGNSVAVVAGDSKYLTIKATERSKVDTRSLDAVAAHVEAVTGAEIFVKATERLEAKARNASSIYYAGNPTLLIDRSAGTSVGSGVFNIGHKER